MSRSARRLLLAALLSLTGSAPVGAQDVPAELQMTLLVRILTFDRNLAARAGEELVIGIVFQPGYPVSRDFQRDVEAAWSASAKSAGSLPIRVVPIELTRAGRLTDALRRAGADVALIAPLRAVDVGAIVAAARNAGAGTFGSLAEYVERGCAVGFAVERGKPRIRINLEAARAEGSDYRSELLAMAEVVR